MPQIQEQIVEVVKVIQEEQGSEWFVEETVEVTVHVPTSARAPERSKELTATNQGQTTLENHANV